MLRTTENMCLLVFVPAGRSLIRFRVPFNKSLFFSFGLSVEMDQLSKIITRLEQIEESFFLCVRMCVCVLRVLYGGMSGKKRGGEYVSS